MSRCRISYWKVFSGIFQPVMLVFKAADWEGSTKTSGCEQPGGKIQSVRIFSLNHKLVSVFAVKTQKNPPHKKIFEEIVNSQTCPIIHHWKSELVSVSWMWSQFIQKVELDDATPLLSTLYKSPKFLFHLQFCRLSTFKFQFSQNIHL